MSDHPNHRRGIVAALAAAGLLAGAGSAAAAPCPAGTTPPANTVGLEFVLDHSTSMENPSDGTQPNDPQRLRVQAAQLALAQLTDGDTVGTMKFNSTAAVITAPAVLSATNRQTLSGQISTNIGATAQGTNYEAAFAQAKLELDQMCAAKKAVIFLSDGIPTAGDINSTNYKALGVPVYTIALGAAAVTTRLDTIAKDTGGQAFPAATAANIQDSFIKAASAARGFNAAGAGSVVIKPGEVKDTPIAVVAGTTSLSANVSWPVGSFKVVLLDPVGTVIDGSLPPLPTGATASLGGSFTQYTVANPSAGNWTLRVTGVTGAASGTSVNIAIALASPAAKPPVVAPPTVVVSKLKSAVKSLARGKRTKITFTLSAAAKVKVLFNRAGKKGGAKSLTLQGKAGNNVVILPASFVGKALKKGAYRISISAEGGTTGKLTVPLLK